MGNQGQASSKSDPSHDVVQPQTQESMEAAINGEKCEGREVAIIGPGLGNSIAMQCEDAGVSNGETEFGLDGDQANHGFHSAISYLGNGDGGFLGHGYFVSRGEQDKGGVEAERMDLEGGGGSEEPQC